MELNKKPVQDDLYYAVLAGRPVDDRYSYNIFIGTTDELRRLEREWARNDQLLKPKNLSVLPEKMALAMKTHHDENVQDFEAGAVHCGRIKFQVHQIGGKTIAYADEYTPKTPEFNFWSGRYGDGPIPGIRGAILEAECLKHLKTTAGITHMATVDGHTLLTEHKQGNQTNEARRKQLIAHGIAPLEIHPIGEWIKKLGSKPDYSRVSV
jgi:hypothetical protein